MKKILIIEDQPLLAKNIAEYLQLKSFKVDMAYDGQSGLEQAQTGDFDLIILDINLPVLTGMQICQQLRLEGNPVLILMLTAYSMLQDRVQGLNTGADDYLTKPFDLTELEARIAALLRRTVPQKAVELRLPNGVEINFLQRELKQHKKPVSLSPKAFDLVAFLAQHLNRPQSCQTLLEAVWGESEAEKLFDSETIEVHISHIRRKLGKKFITTVRGSGYKIAST